MSTPDDAPARVAAFVRAQGIPFARGDVEAFIRRSNAVACRLSVTQLPVAAAARSAYAKGLLTLWAVVVDDAIDREHDRAELDASIAWLAAHDRGTAPPPSRHACARILDELWAVLSPLLPEAALAVLRFDLWEQALGLQYEVLINRAPELAAPAEYGRFAVLVASIKVYVDLDLALAGAPLCGEAYRVVRAMCDALAGAIKYASDVGSLARELWEENNLNAVLLEAREAGVEIGGLRRATAPRALEPAVALIRARAHEQLASARRHAERLPAETDAHGVLDTVAALLETYFEGDPFFGVDSSASAGTLLDAAPTARS